MRDRSLTNVMALFVIKILLEFDPLLSILFESSLLLLMVVLSELTAMCAPFRRPLLIQAIFPVL